MAAQGDVEPTQFLQIGGAGVSQVAPAFQLGECLEGVISSPGATACPVASCFVNKTTLVVGWELIRRKQVGFQGGEAGRRSLGLATVAVSPHGLALVHSAVLRGPWLQDSDQGVSNEGGVANRIWHVVPTPGPAAGCGGHKQSPSLVAVCGGHRDSHGFIAVYDWSTGEIVWRFLTTAAVCKVAPLGEGLLAGIKFTHKARGVELPLDPSEMDPPEQNAFVVNIGLSPAPGRLWAGAEVVVTSCKHIRHESTSDGVYNWAVVALPRHPDARGGPTPLVMTATRASLGVYRLTVWHWPTDTVWVQEHNGYIRGMTLQHRTPDECCDHGMDDTVRQRVHVLSSNGVVCVFEACLRGWSPGVPPTSVEFPEVAEPAKTKAPGNQWSQLIPVGRACSMAFIGWLVGHAPGPSHHRSLIVPTPGTDEVKTFPVNVPQSVTDEVEGGPVHARRGAPVPRREAAANGGVYGHGGCFGGGGLLVLGDRIVRISTTLPAEAEVASVPAPEEQRVAHLAVARALQDPATDSAPDGDWWRWPDTAWRRRRRAALWRWTLNKQRRAARARRRAGR